jgi:hypothetical protein
MVAAAIPAQRQINIGGRHDVGRAPELESGEYSDDFIFSPRIRSSDANSDYFADQ